ncbi:hypothetical protein JCM8547_008952 [Rhodosporidiobolus lusitaniae]
MLLRSLLTLKRTFLAAVVVLATSALLARFSPSSRLPPLTRSRAMSTTRNVVVVGGSYVGQMAAKELIETLPKDHRVVVVDRNSHFGHLFAYPRFAIAPTFEHKAFLPFHPMLPAPHVIVQAEATAIEGGKVKLDRPVKLGEGGEGVKEIVYEALVLATGTKLSKPGTLSTEKKDSIAYLQSVQSKLKEAKNIVIVGGGAVGVQMATDLAILYPSSCKNITVIQSRRLMPRFHPKLNEIVLARFEELGIKTELGVRAEIPEGGYESLNEGEGGGEVVLQDGRRIKADYVIHALGQTPNSQLLQSSTPSAVLPNGFVRVNKSLLVDPVDGREKEKLGGRVWALGDIAESGAPKAARPAMQQAQLVAKSVAKRLNGEGPEGDETYSPGPAAIHLTLGIVESLIFRNPATPPILNPATNNLDWPEDAQPEFFWKDDGKLDMGIDGVWERRVPGFVGGVEERYHL